MFSTVEVRWFYEGAVPREVLEWFQGGERKPEEQACRVDYYLCLADSDALGIKLREGRIEIKQRHRQYGVLRFHERVTGLVEGWHKWSFKLAEADGGLADRDLPASSWVGVRKARELRRYRLTGDKEVMAVSVEDYPERGCNIELTKVSAGGEDWWSLGFEAFGDESILQESFLVVAKHVLAEGGPPVFGARDSYGYPKWLELIFPVTPIPFVGMEQSNI